MHTGRREGVRTEAKRGGRELVRGGVYVTVLGHSPFCAYAECRRRMGFGPGLLS